MQIISSFNQLLKHTPSVLEKTLVVRTTIANYLKWLQDELIGSYEKNRGIFGTNQNSISKVRHQFSDVCLGVIHLSLDTKQGVGTLIDGHGRSQGLLLRLEDGNFTPQELKQTIDLKICHPKYFKEAYCGLNTGIPHNVGAKLTNSDLPMGEMWSQLHSRLVGVDSVLMSKNSFHQILMDFAIVRNENLFKNINKNASYDEQMQNFIENIDKLKLGRSRLTALVKSQTHDHIEYKIKASVFDDVAKALNFYIEFQNKMLAVNSEGYTRKGQTFTPTARALANCAGLMIAVGTDQMQSTPLWDMDLLIRNTTFDCSQTKDSEKFNQILEAGKLIAQKSRKENISAGAEILFRQLSKRKPGPQGLARKTKSVLNNLHV